jgi:glycogen debranching enzyme
MNPQSQGRLTSELTQLRSNEGWLYAGLPKFKALFGRDSIISAIQLLDYDDNIAKETVKALISLQGKQINRDTMEQPGKIIHEFQTDRKLLAERSAFVQWLQEGKNYFSVDSTPLFLTLIVLMYKKDKRNLTHEVYSSFKNGLNWVLKYGLTEKYVSYTIPPFGTGLQSQSWRDGIGSILNQMASPVSVIDVQAYSYYALKQSISILKDKGEDTNFLNELDQVAIKMKTNLYEDFLLEEENFLGIAIDGDGVLNKAITSDPGHLLFSGILSRSQEKEIIGRLFEADVMTDYGLRTLSTKDVYFDPKAYQRGSIWPQDNWFFAYGLKERGYTKEYKELKNRLCYAADLLKGLPEYFGVSKDSKLIPLEKLRIKPCYPQAWSTGSELYLRQH